MREDYMPSFGSLPNDVGFVQASEGAKDRKIHIAWDYKQQIVCGTQLKRTDKDEYGCQPVNVDIKNYKHEDMCSNCLVNFANESFKLLISAKRRLDANRPPLHRSDFPPPPRPGLPPPKPRPAPPGPRPPTPRPPTPKPPDQRFR